MHRMSLAAILAVIAQFTSVCGTASRFAIAEDKKLTPDAGRIQGHWISVQRWENGLAVSRPPIPIVVTDKEMKLGFGGEYKLDASQTPKRLDLRYFGARLEGIYRFEGDKLWLCVSLTTAIPRPSDFVARPSDRHIIIVAERSKPVADGRPLMVAPGFTIADRKVTDELRGRVANAAKLLEAGQFAKLFKDILSADELAEMLKREKKSLDEYAKEPMPKTQAAGLAKTLRALDKKIPAINGDGTWAYFDLQDIHFNGAPLRPVLLFRKVNGRWYMTEKAPTTPMQ
jgi:uncharacterized protein (TIGR03067 family)